MRTTALSAAGRTLLSTAQTWQCGSAIQKRAMNWLFHVVSFFNKCLINCSFLFRNIPPSNTPNMFLLKPPLFSNTQTLLSPPFFQPFIILFEPLPPSSTLRPIVGIDATSYRMHCAPPSPEPPTRFVKWSRAITEGNRQSRDHAC